MPKLHKTFLTFLKQAGAFLSFQAIRPPSTRSSTSDLTAVQLFFFLEGGGWCTDSVSNLCAFMACSKKKKKKKEKAGHHFLSILPDDQMIFLELCGSSVTQSIALKARRKKTGEICRVFYAAWCLATTPFVLNVYVFTLSINFVLAVFSFTVCRPAADGDSFSNV